MPRLEAAEKSNENNEIIVIGIDTTIHNLREECDGLKRQIKILERAAKDKTEPPVKKDPL